MYLLYVCLDILRYTQCSRKKVYKLYKLNIRLILIILKFLLLTRDDIYDLYDI